MKKTIELRTYRAESNLDLSNTSRAPLVLQRHDTNKISNIQIKIEKEFRKLNMITNINKVIIYIYECLLFDVITNFYYGYQLISSLTDITKIIVSLIYFFEYSFSVLNAVLYLNIIINYNDYKKVLEMQKVEDRAFRLKEKKNRIIEEESLNGITLHLSKPMGGINSVINSRITTWFIKYVLYILIVANSVEYSFFEYLNIYIIVFDYFLFSLLIFYYKVLLRIEAYKHIYHLEEPN